MPSRTQDAPGRSARMELLLGSALTVVSEQGLRGLTHRAVDREAGLPEGSCSAYLRTREALILALSEYVADRMAARVRDLADELAGCSLDDDQAYATVTRSVLGWLDERDLLVALLELTIQASRDPALAQRLGAHRRVLAEVVGGMLTARGKQHGAAAAETMVASFDGVLISALPRPATQRKAFVRRSVEALLAGLG
jgi:DNA-binding transcriptional regulator YbjK